MTSRLTQCMATIAALAASTFVLTAPPATASPATGSLLPGLDFGSSSATPPGGGGPPGGGSVTVVDAETEEVLFTDSGVDCEEDEEYFFVRSDHMAIVGPADMLRFWETRDRGDSLSGIRIHINDGPYVYGAEPSQGAALRYERSDDIYGAIVNFTGGPTGSRQLSFEFTCD